ncbi:MAG: YfbK domain-containing protein [Candidatus Anammoxibacter sp.]
MSDRINEELLTAYVLNELDETERNRVESAVQNDPDLMQEVQMIKSVCSTVKSELLDAPLPELTGSQKRSIRDSLAVQPLKERYGIRYFFEWKIMAPALCVSVLALLIFLNVPAQMFGKKNVTDLKQFTTMNDSVVSTTLPVAKSNRTRVARTKTVGKIGVMDSYQPFVSRDRNFMNRVSSGYFMENMRNNNLNGLFGYDLIGSGKLFKNSKPMQLVNRDTTSRYALPHYNLQNYEIIYRNRNKPVADNSQYVIPINVDTTGYDNVRQLLGNNQMPPSDAVNIEEMINYFDYNYSSSDDGLPFTVITEISRSPWNDKHKLVHIGFRGNKIRGVNLPNSNQHSKHVTTAKDIRVRLEFDPNKIKAYRLIGYEKMDRDAGGKNIYRNCEMYANELYAGQMGTVLYELIPADSSEGSRSNKIITLKLGYKLPDKDQWHIFICPVVERYVPFDDASDNFRFSTAVAGFGMLLKNSGYNRNLTYSDVIRIAKGSKGKDLEGRRAEFIRLVETAERLVAEKK